MAEDCAHASACLVLGHPDWAYRCPKCGLSSEHHEGPQAALEGFKRLAPGFEAGDTHYSHARSFLLGSA